MNQKPSGMERHYANTKYGAIRWERYTDDIIVHCKNETEARYIRDRIGERLTGCKLELHPDKTKIVHCKQSNRRGKYDKHISFDFLGFTFRPDRVYRRDENGKGSLWVGYAVSISRKAKKRLVQQIMRWKIHRATGAELGEIAQQKSRIIRGWIYYYGRFRLYSMRTVFRALNVRIIR